eukprot:5651600-Pleurochrysis_carterae.AAC.1
MSSLSVLSVPVLVAAAAALPSLSRVLFVTATVSVRSVGSRVSATSTEKASAAGIPVRTARYDFERRRCLNCSATERAATSVLA